MLGIGEGNGNPLQYSCLENPRDSGAWWVAVYGVAQSRTRLKRLSNLTAMLGIGALLVAIGRPGFDPWVWKIPWRSEWQPTPVEFSWRIPMTEEPGEI